MSTTSTDIDQAWVLQQLPLTQEQKGELITHLQAITQQTETKHESSNSNNQSEGDQHCPEETEPMCLDD